MDSLLQLRKDLPDLWDDLLQYECEMSSNGVVLYKGKLTEEQIDSYKDTKKDIYVRFNIDKDRHVMLSLNEDNATNKFESYIKSDQTFEELMNDPKTFNSLMNLANSLPDVQINSEILKEYITPTIKKSITKYGNNYRKLFEHFILIKEEDGDGLPDEDEEKNKEKLTERGNIKFTIWKEPDKKIKWLDSNTGYQKIEYIYKDEKEGMQVDFLLGFKEGSWRLWVGKVGSVSYDDDPYCNFETSKFSEAIILALDKVQEMIEDIKEDPANWVQFFVNV